MRDSGNPAEHSRSCRGVGTRCVMSQPVRARRLTEHEGQYLLRLVRRGNHETIRVRRALIIMASASGTTVPAIARLVAADEDTVRDVIHAFNAEGLACLGPHWAGGRPRRITDADLTLIVATATTRPRKLGLPFTHWSMRKLAAYLTGRYSLAEDRLWGVTHEHKGGKHTLSAFKSIGAARPDGAPIYIICDNLAANTTPAIRAWARRNKVELCLTPTNASWADPIEAQFGPLRAFTVANSDY